MKRLAGVAIAAIITTAGNPAHAQITEKTALTLEGARQVIATAVGEARRLGAPGGAIAVVDDGGNLIAVERLDGTFAAAPNISIGKARTAAIFKKPTKFFEDVIAGGRTPMVALNDFTPLQGGVPLTVGEEVIGAIGVSGAATAQQDEEIAMAGAAAARALRRRTTGATLGGTVTFIDSTMVRRGFEKGAVLVDGGNYMIHASHREKDGIAEIHTLDADLVHVLSGAATLVTGGSVADATVIEPNERRGAAIMGGESRRIGPGDVIVIPAGVPHMFTEVQGPFDYYVVKVR